MDCPPPADKADTEISYLDHHVPQTESQSIPRFNIPSCQWWWADHRPLYWCWDCARTTVDASAPVKSSPDADCALFPYGVCLDELELEAISCGKTDDFYNTDPVITLSSPASARLAYRTGLLYGTRFSKSELAADLNAAICAYEQAIASFPSVDVCRPYALVDLGNALHIRHRRAPSIDSGVELDRAIGALREALPAWPDSHPIHSYILDSLACLLCDQSALLNHRWNYEPKKNVFFIEDAIAVRLKVLDLFPPPHPARPTWLPRLVVFLTNCFCHVDRCTMDLAVQLAQESVDLTPEDHENRPFALEILAYAIYARLDPERRSLSLDDLPEIALVVGYSEERLSLEPTAWFSLRMLADALKCRAQVTGEDDLWLRTLALGAEALKLCPLKERHQLLYLAAEDLLIMPDALRRPEHVVLAKAHAEEALEIMKDGHPGRHVAHYCLALAHLQQGALPAAVHHLALMVSDPLGHVRDRHWYASRVLAALPAAVPRASAKELLEVYRQTALLPPRISFWGVGLRERLAALAQGGALGRAAALLALGMGTPARAVQCLEDGRAVFWAQSLHLRASFAGLPPAMAEEMAGLSQALEACSLGEEGKGGEPEVLARADAARRRMDARFNDLVHDARKMPGMERFMMGPDYDELSLAAVHSKGPIVMLLPGADHCHAISITPDRQARHIPLPYISTEVLSALAQEFRRESQICRSTLRDALVGDRLKLNKLPLVIDTCRTRGALGQLWKFVVRPIADALRLSTQIGRDRPRVTWIPTGIFAFVPIHAAGLYTGSSQVCCSDYFVSSYAPTLGALRHAQKQINPILRRAVKILLAAAPSANGGDWLQLPFTVEELREIAAVVPEGSILPIPPEDRPASRTPGDVGAHSGGITVRTVLDSLPSANILHLACHGHQNAENPLQSGFVLRDGVLTIAQLMRMRLPHALLAFLSACETAKGDADQPDQTVHLAAAMMFVGFKSVIATLWSMGDIDGPLVARRVYSELFEKGDSDEIDLSAVPYALDAAVQELRKMDPNPMRWAPYIHIGC